MRRSALLLVALLAACATRKADADSAAAANAIDTLKPAVVASTDSVGATTAAAASTKAGAQTSTKAPSTGTKTRRDSALVARDTAHLGRDSVIKINPRDPRRMIPTQKKP